MQSKNCFYENSLLIPTAADSDDKKKESQGTINGVADAILKSEALVCSNLFDSKRFIDNPAYFQPVLNSLEEVQEICQNLQESIQKMKKVVQKV